MKFKGDIIITDPCYILKDNDDDWSKCDFGKGMEALGIKTYLTSNTEYGDWSCTTFKDDDKTKKALKEIEDIYFQIWNAQNFEKDQKRVEKLKKKELKIKEKYKDLILGNFCADAGLVSVFLLDEVLKYNPNFDYHINRKWTTTLIKNFDGDIEIIRKEVEYVDQDTKKIEKDFEVSVVGKGNINFYTTQTGF